MELVFGTSPSWAITAREKPESFERALGAEPDDIKVVVQFSEA